MSHAGSAIFIIIWLLFAAVILAGGVYWVIALVEVCRIPDGQYRAAGQEKITWILLLVLLHLIGAVAWAFGPRKRVLAAAGHVLPARGWYPDPATG